MMKQIEDHYLENNQQIILIRPDLSNISAFDLDTLDKAMNIGYDAAAAVLKKEKIFV